MCTNAYTLYTHKHTLSNTHTQYILQILTKRKKIKTSSQQPGTLSHPCTHLLWIGETEKREKGKQQDRTLEVAGIH